MPTNEELDALKISYNPNSVAGKIIAEASKYVDILEIKDNQGWQNNDAFTNKMKAIGWQKGYAYCAAFVRMVMQQITSGAAKDFFKANITLGAKDSWNRLSAKKNDYCEVIQKPESGCLVCYDGHIEFCKNVLDNGFLECVSANSMAKDAQGNDIEGVFLKKRKAASALGSEPFLGYIRILKLD